MRPIYIEKCLLVLKQVVSITRVVLILSGLNSKVSLYKQFYANYFHTFYVAILENYSMQKKNNLFELDVAVFVSFI